MKKRDRTSDVVAKAMLYVDASESFSDQKKAKQGVYEIYATFVREAFGLEEVRVLSGGRKIKVWRFSDESEYARGELSASRIAALLIKYRRALKSLGAVHKRFKPSLSEAKKILTEAGVPEHLVKGLNPNIRIKTLEDRIATLKRTWPGGSGTGAMVRIALAGIKIYHPSYYRLGGAVSYLKSITNEKQKAQLKAKHDRKIFINPDFLLKKALSVLTSSSSPWISVAVALCAVTGRRPTEIMKTARFRTDENTPENYIRFNGVLKSRDRKYDDDFGEWDIPVFAEPELIVKALRRMRKTLKAAEGEAQKAGGKGNYWTGGYLRFTDKSGKEKVASIFDRSYLNDVDHNVAINQQYNGMLNDELRRWFNSGDIDIKSLRAVYTKMVWEREKDNSPETYESMTTRVLCYSQSSLSEAVKHYAAIELSDKTESIDTSTGNDERYVPSAELLALMEQADSVIARRSLRAPALKRVHEWAKAKATAGLAISELTVTYIRKFCLADGKKVNANTAALYIEILGLLRTKQDKSAAR